MNFIKDSLLHLRENALATKEDERVIVHGKIQICGNVHRLLPTNLSRPLTAAFIASPDDSNQTSFTLILGGLRVSLCHAMTLHPSIEVAQRQSPENHDHTISINTKDGKYVIIKLDSLVSFKEWHKSLCDALAEMIFTNAFTYNSVHILSPAKLEVAMKRASRLVPTCNCHMLRAKRLWNIKMELLEILHRLDQDLTSLTKEHVHNFLAGSDVDRLIAEDADYLRLKAMEPTLPFSLPASMMHEDLSNVTLTTDMPDPAFGKSRKAPSPVPRQGPANTRSVEFCGPPPQLLHSAVSCSASANAKVAPTISDHCQIFEESDLHWDICSPEKLVVETKGAAMVDQGTDTADLAQPALSPPSSEEKNKTDVYKQIDEIIDLLSEFSPSLSGSSLGQSRRAGLSVSGLSLSPSLSSAGQPPATEDIKKGVLDAIDDVVDKFASSCHAHNSLCMVSRIEGDPSDPNQSIHDIHPGMDTPSSLVPIFSHLPENQPSALDCEGKEGVMYSPAASPPSSPFEPDEILRRCTFTADDKMTAAELLDPSEEPEKLTSCDDDMEQENQDRKDSHPHIILTESPVRSPTQGPMASPRTPRSGIPKTPKSARKSKRFSFDNSKLASEGEEGAENAVDKENLPNENIAEASPESHQQETDIKNVTETKVAIDSTMDNSAVHGSNELNNSGLHASQLLYTSFFSVDHSYSFYNISSSTIIEEDPEISGEIELSSIEEFEDRKLVAEHIVSTKSPSLIIAVRESPVTISLQRSQKAEVAARLQQEIARNLSRKSEMRLLATVLVLVLAVLVCGAIVLRDVHEAIKESNKATSDINSAVHGSYNVSNFSYTINTFEAANCQKEDVTLMAVLSASAKPLAKRASGALLAFQAFLATHPNKDVVLEAAKKVWNILKFSAKGLIRAVTLMPQKHSDILMSW